jgi:hypothetical protein
MEVGEAVSVRGKETCCDEDEAGASGMRQLKSALRDGGFFVCPVRSGFDETLCARQHDGVGSTRLLTDELEELFTSHQPDENNTSEDCRARSCGAQEKCSGDVSLSQ